jgi:hypothetical protein
MLITVELCDRCPVPEVMTLRYMTDEGHHLVADLEDVSVSEGAYPESHRVLCGAHLAEARRVLGLCPSSPDGL